MDDVGCLSGHGLGASVHLSEHDYDCGAAISSLSILCGKLGGILLKVELLLSCLEIWSSGRWVAGSGVCAAGGGLLGKRGREDERNDDDGLSSMLSRVELLGPLECDDGCFGKHVTSFVRLSRRVEGFRDAALCGFVDFPDLCSTSDFSFYSDAVDAILMYALKPVKGLRGQKKICMHSCGFLCGKHDVEVGVYVEKKNFEDFFFPELCVEESLEELRGLLERSISTMKIWRSLIEERGEELGKAKRELVLWNRL